MRTLQIFALTLILQIFAVECIYLGQDELDGSDDSPITLRRNKKLKCGYTKKKPKKKHRIINGREAVPGEFPWQVGLITEHRYECGGSIIDERHVLTAAHCIDKFMKSPRNVEVGSHYKYDYSPDSKLYQVEKRYAHEGFTGSVSRGNDIAILRVSKPMKFKLTSKGFGSTNRVCLPKETRIDMKKNSTLTVSGYGLIKFMGASATSLRTVDVNLITSEKCKELYGSVFQPHDLNSIICTYTPRKDACQGDSGGPLIREVKGRFEQVGIVSWGHGCAFQNNPGVYTSVSYYTDWIRTTLNKSWKEINKKKKKKKKKKKFKFYFFEFDDFENVDDILDMVENN